MDDDWKHLQENESFDKIEDSGKASQKSHERLQHLKYQLDGGVLDQERYHILQEALHGKRYSLAGRDLSDIDIEDCMKAAEGRVIEWLQARTLDQIRAYQRACREQWSKFYENANGRPPRRDFVEREMAWPNILGKLLGIKPIKPRITPPPPRPVPGPQDDSLVIRQSYTDGLRLVAYSPDNRMEYGEDITTFLPPGEYWREDTAGERVGITLVWHPKGKPLMPRAIVNLDLERRMMTEVAIVMKAGYVTRKDVEIEAFLAQKVEGHRALLTFRPGRSAAHVEELLREEEKRLRAYLATCSDEEVVRMHVEMMPVHYR